MTLSLKQRFLAALRTPLRRYAGHRTLQDVIGTVETLQRQRGDIDDSAVRVADLPAVGQALLDYHLAITDHSGTGGGGTSTPWDFDEGSASTTYGVGTLDLEGGSA